MIIKKTNIKKQHLPNLERAGMITTQATHSTNPEIKLLQRVHVIIITTIITIIITIMIKSLHMIIRGEERGGREFFSLQILFQEMANYLT